MISGSVMAVALDTMPMERLGGPEEQGSFLLNFRRDKAPGWVLRKSGRGNVLMTRSLAGLMNKFSLNRSCLDDRVTTGRL